MFRVRKCDFCKKLFIVLTFSLIITCSEREHTNPLDPYNSGMIPEGLVYGTSTVNTAVFGNQDLYILSAFQENTQIKNGRYSTLVSETGTQVLFILDQNEKIKGLTLSQISDSKSIILSGDAWSTALAIMFLTPGIATSDPHETEKHIGLLKSLPVFSALVTQLNQNLADNYLEDLLKKPEIDSLFCRCVREFYFTNKGGSLRKTGEIQELKNFFNVAETSNNGNLAIELRNHSFRKVNVFRRYMKNDAEASSSKVIDHMGGAVAYSWGALFTLSLGQPTVEIDASYNPLLDCSTTEYWVIGPGFRTSQATPPASIDKGTSDLWFDTIFWYLACPIIDVVTGGTKMLEIGKSLESYRFLWSQAKIGLSVVKLEEAPNTTAYAREGINLSIALIRSAAAAGVLTAKVGIGAVALKVLVVSSALFGAANGLAWAIDMAQVQPYSQFIITNSNYHQVSTPSMPTGPSSGIVNEILNYTVFGSSCPQGHNIEYQFDWGDGTKSNWGAAIQNHAYSTAKTYMIKVRARCATNNEIISNWSGTTSVTILEIHSVSKPSTLSGPTNGTLNQSLSYTAGGSSCSRGHAVQYQFDWGDGVQSNWSTTTQSHIYTASRMYTVKVRAHCIANTTVRSDWSIGKSVTISIVHTVSKPNVPTGPDNGTAGQSLSYSAGGSSCSQGHAVQYQFDWDDGAQSGWGTATQSHAYATAGPYTIKVRAQCATDNTIISEWSATKSVTISSVHTVFEPNVPTGPNTGTLNELLVFKTGGSSCSQGHAIQYQFDWGDGAQSNWGTATQSHAYNMDITYSIKVRARCSVDHMIISDWSTGKYVQILETSGYVKGEVIDASTQSGLSGVKIKFYKSGSYINEVSSDYTGQFEMALSAGTGYYLDFTKTGYISEVYYNVDVETDQTTWLTKIMQVSQSNSGMGSVGGQIIDALNGTGISNVSIKLRRGINVMSGDIVGSTQTNTNGYYTVYNLSAGNYTAELDCSGYNSTFFRIVCIGGQHKENQNTTLTPLVAAGQWRIILTWGAYPNDLDSHLTGPTNSGDRFHVYYPSASRGAMESSPYAFLDRDDRDGDGPETITIATQLAGIYRYSVFNYSDRSNSSSTELSNSSAKVEVYKGANLIRVFNVPSGRTGTLWTVFELSGNVITPVNTIDYISSSGSVPIKVPEYEFRSDFFRGK